MDDQKDTNEQKDKEKLKNFPGRPKEEWEIINERFYFLPEGGNVAVIIAFPFALFAGFGAEQFNKIIDGCMPDLEEIEILKWTYDIGSNLMRAFTTEDLSEKTEALNEALDIAAEYIEPEEAERALDMTIIYLQKKIDELHNIDGRKN